MLDVDRLLVNTTVLTRFAASDSNGWSIEFTGLTDYERLTIEDIANRIPISSENIVPSGLGPKGTPRNFWIKGVSEHAAQSFLEAIRSIPTAPTRCF
jgi:hypothetical protein